MREEQQAKRGDTRKIMGEEYESIGTPAEAIAAGDKDEWESATVDDKGKTELWRKKKKKEAEKAVPTS